MSDGWNLLPEKLTDQFHDVVEKHFKKQVIEMINDWDSHEITKETNHHFLQWTKTLMGQSYGHLKIKGDDLMVVCSYLEDSEHELDLNLSFADLINDCIEDGDLIDKNHVAKLLREAADKLEG